MTGFDVSPGMVGVARSRGVEARVGSAETVDGSFDGALSDFGALNCLPSLEPVGVALRRVLRPGAWFLAVVMGPRCVAEDLALLARGRRPRRRGRVTLGGEDVPTRYLDAATVLRELGDGFVLRRREALGALVAPPDLGGRPGFGSRLDARLGALPLVRELGDHTLLELRRR